MPLRRPLGGARLAGHRVPPPQVQLRSQSAPWSSGHPGASPLWAIPAKFRCALEVSLALLGCPSPSSSSSSLPRLCRDTACPLKGAGRLAVLHAGLWGGSAGPGLPIPTQVAQTRAEHALSPIAQVSPSGPLAAPSKREELQVPAGPPAGRQAEPRPACHFWQAARPRLSAPSKAGASLGCRSRSPNRTREPGPKKAPESGQGGSYPRPARPSSGRKGPGSKTQACSPWCGARLPRRGACRWAGSLSRQCGLSTWGTHPGLGSRNQSPTHKPSEQAATAARVTSGLATLLCGSSPTTSFSEPFRNGARESDPQAGPGPRLDATVPQDPARHRQRGAL